MTLFGTCLPLLAAFPPPRFSAAPTYNRWILSTNSLRSEIVINTATSISTRNMSIVNTHSTAGQDQGEKGAPKSDVSLKGGQSDDLQTRLRRFSIGGARPACRSRSAGLGLFTQARHLANEAESHDAAKRASKVQRSVTRRIWSLRPYSPPLCMDPGWIRTLRLIRFGLLPTLTAVLHADRF